MRASATLMLAIVFLITGGCGTKEEQGGETERPSASSAVPVPEISLHAAAASGNMEAIRGHIAAGSDLDVRDPEGGACPLSTAALFGRTEAALALIEAGADIDCRGADGATPLHVAAFFCRPEIVRALLDKGADTKIRNKYGSTPLETVTAPFEVVRPVYEQFGKTFESMGLKIDLERIERTRPEIEKMLRPA